MATLYINGAPHQSLKARFPGITHAATDLGVTRTHLWQVLSGKRESKPLVARWQQWLANHPEFSALQPDPEPEPAIDHNAFHAALDRIFGFVGFTN